MDALTNNPPAGATVRFTDVRSSDGWDAVPAAPWLLGAIDVASNAAFGKDARYFGEGGSIPFIGMLGALFPRAQFAVIGALGPGSNAHGPNEFLDLVMATRLTLAIGVLLDVHAKEIAG